MADSIERIADDLSSWLRQPFVSLTAMRVMDVQEFITRLRALSPAGGDWVMVPREPTKEMCAAGERERLSRPTNMNPYHVWAAMLAASPQQEPGAEGLRDAISASLYELSLVGEGREHDEAVAHIEKRITSGQTLAGAGGALMKCVCGDPKDGGGCTNKCDRGQIPQIPAATYRVTDGKLQKATATSAGTTGDAELLVAALEDSRERFVNLGCGTDKIDEALDAARCAREVGNG